MHSGPAVPSRSGRKAKGLATSSKGLATSFRWMQLLLKSDSPYVSNTQTGFRKDVSRISLTIRIARHLVLRVLSLFKKLNDRF
jgi:hypothetical protein